MEKRRNSSLGASFPLFHTIFYLLLDFHVQAVTRFSLRDKRLFVISEVEITRVDCIDNEFLVLHISVIDCSLYLVYV